LERRRIEDPTASGGSSERVVCTITQVPVAGGQPQGTGWYYDNFSSEVKDTCPDQQQQQIAFSANADLETGSEARVECFQPVARIDLQARGREAVNSPCGEGGNECRSDAEKGEQLICLNQTCQLACPTRSNSECPPGWVCFDGGESPSFCVNPTCPPSFTQ
jgi:hypothetical protein